MSARQQDLVKAIDYPESDGQPMGETDKHIQLMIDLRMALQTFFLANQQIYVGSNLMCYYEKGNNAKSISPDVFVVKGAAKHERRVYKFWEEPVPQVVLEITSRKTRKDDFGEKKDLYAWLGVQEYFVFNPVVNKTLRLFDPHTQEFLRTPAEEAIARQEAEARAARLAAKLRELGLDPDQL